MILLLTLGSAAVIGKKSRTPGSLARMFEKCQWCWEHEFMTGDDQDDTSTAREAVVVARRDAAMAQARLAEAAVRYADARIAGDIAAGVGVGSAQPG